MLNTSVAFKQLATDPKRSDKAYLMIDGVRFDDEGPNGRLDSISYEYMAESFIGGFNASSIVVELYYEGLTDLDWMGKEIEVYVGFEGAEYVLVGTFYVPDTESIETDDDAKVVTLTAYDFAIDFDHQYQEVALPAKGRDIVEEIAIRNGLELDSLSEKLTFDDHVFDLLNIGSDENITDRQVINMYAALNLCVAMISREGKLKFVSVLDANPQIAVTGQNYQDISVEAIEGPINSLVYEQGDVDDPVFTKDDTSIDTYGMTEVKIKENIFISLFDHEEQQSVIDTLFSLINGYVYTPFSIEGYDARPDLDCLDMIIIEDTSDVSHISPIMSISWDYTGSLDGSLGSVVLPETLTDYTLAGESQDFINMGVKVNRHEKSITSVINQVDEQGERLSQSEQTLEGFRETVYSKTETNELMNETVATATEGWSNTYSKSGGANLIQNSSLAFGRENDYHFWEGDLKRVEEVDAVSGFASLLKAGIVTQHIINVAKGFVSLRFNYKKTGTGLDPKMQFKINEDIFDLLEENGTVEISFESSSGIVDLSFMTDTSDQFRVYDLMFNYGKDIYLNYQQAYNETDTGTVKISKDITVDSNLSNTTTVIGANGLEGYNKTTGSIIFKLTDSGSLVAHLEAESANIGGLTIKGMPNGHIWIVGG